MEIISALTLGLLGSFHCIGMCGPIAVALPLKNDSWFTRIFSALLYNLGRTLTYGVMGLVFGLLGSGFRMAGLQQWASIIIGIIMILSVIFPALFRNHVNLDAWVTKLTSRLKSAFGKLFSTRSYMSLWIIGLLNGLLPCGLVYMAIAGAIVTSSMVSGAVYMVIFGLGTIPVMLALSVLGNIVSLRFRNFIRKIVPVFIIIIGLLFILRGMNLGIKYISPKMEKEETTKMECCH
jgi:sulfite exporter TauE/SafE